MPYVQLDDQIAQHPKVLRAGGEAAWLWACAIAYCNRQLTDGYLPTEALATMGAFRTAAKKLAEVLVSVGLFDKAPGGYRVHDYLLHNPDRATVLQRRATAAERKARQRDRAGTGRARHDDVTVGHTRDEQGDTSVTLASSRGRVPTPTPTPTPTDDDTARPRGAESSSSNLAPIDLHGWRTAALELLELWHIEGPPGDRLAFDALTPRSRRQLRDALALRGLDAWEATFRRVARSDYLAGRGDLPAISLWRCLELADRIDAGEFDTRTRPSAPVAPALAQDRVFTADDLATIREEQRLAAEEREARRARGEGSLGEQLRRQQAVQA